MKYDPNTHHRHSIRLPAYDYAQAGAYFVTICTQIRECVFGEVNQGQMIPNGASQMVESVWHQLPQSYPGVEVDAFVVMPNHVHGIIVLVGATTGGPSWATTGGRPYEDPVVAGCCPSVQIVNRGQIPPGRSQ